MGAFDDLVPGGRGNKDPQTRKALNERAEQAGSASEVKTLYRNARDAMKRFKTGPMRAMFMDAALPDEKGGLADRAGALLIGAPLRAIGAITPQNVSDFQYLKSLQSERVAERQLDQKGVQTESDAARYMLADVSPYKTPEANKKIIKTGEAKLDRVIGRANFYAQFANKYGLNGVDEQGRGVEKAFQDSLNEQTWRGTQTPDGGWSIKRIK